MTARAQKTERTRETGAHTDVELVHCATCSRTFACIGEHAARCPCGGSLMGGVFEHGLFELTRVSTPVEASSLQEAVPASVLKPRAKQSKLKTRASDEAADADEGITEVAEDSEIVDHGYGESHGYGPSHGGPTGPGDAPAREPATVVPVDDDVGL